MADEKEKDIQKASKSKPRKKPAKYKKDEELTPEELEIRKKYRYILSAIVDIYD